MARKVILAAAGSGKTYHICNQLEGEKNNLILAFTHANVRNIGKELAKRPSGIPANTFVGTFDSFIYRYIYKAYAPLILHDIGFRQELAECDVTLNEAPTQTMKKNGKSFPNPQYVKKFEEGHYFDRDGNIYMSRLSELLIDSGKGNKKETISRIAAEIGSVFDLISIDEFQDYREFDYDLIIELSKHWQNSLFVGDFYQHSVSGQNNSGRPYDKFDTADSFAKELVRLGFDVDTDTLAKSRRCPKDVCQLVTNALGIKIESEGINHGTVHTSGFDIDRILSDDSIYKLVFKESSRKSFKAVNWSYSKGDTYPSCAIILTKESSPIKNGKTISLKPETRNKLYVALTRTEGDLYLISNDELRRWKDSHF